MGQTIAEKILSAGSGRRVSAGELCLAEVDLAFAQDGTAPLAIEAFEKLGGTDVFSPDRAAFFIDHSAPSPNMGVSRLHQMMRRFASEKKIRIFDVGSGVCHVLVSEQGLVRCGDLVIGADSHTPTSGALNAFATGVGSTDLAAALISGRLWFKVPETIRVEMSGCLPERVSAKDAALYLIGELRADGANYKCLEPRGPGARSLGIDGRFTIANLAMEAGAKACVFEADEETFRWLEKHGVSRSECRPVSSDPDAAAARLDCALDGLEPLVAAPHAVDNVKKVAEVAGTPLDQAFLGTCTNGRLEDFRAAAAVIAGRRVHPRCRLVVAPGSRDILLEGIREGVIPALVEAGAALVTPGCGPCVGTHNGVPSDGERVISTANRNFKGRMGNPESEIFLASPETVAASAVAGEITDPRGF